MELFMMGATAILFLLFLFLLFISFTIVLSAFKSTHYPPFSPPLSIIIPCYNEEEHIVRTLDAIFASTYEDFEVIVVDDGSTDHTASVVKKYTEKVRLVKGEHKGKSEALNLGVKHARNDFIISLDADTLVREDAIERLVLPMQDPYMGASNGSSLVKNTSGLLGLFQKLEYYNNNLVRKSFSDLFGTGIWFFGAFACYRKKVIEEIGYFKRDTLTEDMDIALEIYDHGYLIANVYDAIGYTHAPKTVEGFVRQRTRWWLGVLQSLHKSRHLFSRGSSPSVLFLFINQYWWTFYALFSFLIIGYQFMYWYPGGTEVFWYTIRWFSLWGPLHVIYKIPEWGLNVSSIFGVLSGIINALILIYAVRLFGDRITFRNIFGIFFYFPYTIFLNAIILLSIIRNLLRRERYFIV